MERLIEVKYDLQLNYSDNEGVDVSDLSGVVIEMVAEGEYEGLEDMRDWLQAKSAKLYDLVNRESDRQTYSILLKEWDKTNITLQGVEFGLTMLEG